MPGTVRRTPSGLRGPAGCSARKLTDEEIRKIAQDLANQAEATTNPIAHTGIEQMINDAVLQRASDGDVARGLRAARRWRLATG